MAAVQCDMAGDEPSSIQQITVEHSKEWMTELDIWLLYQIQNHDRLIENLLNIDTSF